MKLMLDTNICIALIRRKPPRVLQRLAAYKVGDIGISWVTLATNNTREFSRIRGLRVVDWLAGSNCPQVVRPRGVFIFRDVTSSCIFMPWK